MSKRHVHADMIIAKANNMDLVVFIKDCKGWREMSDQTEIRIKSTMQYFLCLPKHQEACLHWLNGGASQYLSNCMGSWINFGDNKEWIATHLFMSNECEIRIKPRKEKRWVGFNSKTMKATHETYKTGFECEDALNDIGEIYEMHPWQFIEIEVEV